MRTIPNKLCPVWIGQSDLIIQKLLKERPEGQVSLITEETVHQHCLHILENVIRLFDIGVITVPTGEKSKQIRTCNIIWQHLADAGVDRNGCIIALGGGMVTDLAGFIASTYLRGIDLISLPTTVLAQVDAAIGGKTGVDLGPVKNYVGTFYQPVHVIMDHRFLSTLPERQIRNGLAEVIKHSMIAGGEEWEYWQVTRDLASVDWEQRVASSARIKIRIVEEDFREKGLRKILNLGHSLGHAIESACMEQDMDILHGEAVSAGLWCESWLALQKGWMDQNDWEEIRNCLESLFTKIDLTAIPTKRIIHYLMKDKKNRNGKILINGLCSPGSYQLDQEISEEEAAQSIQAYKRY